MAYADVTDPLYEFYQGEVNVYVNHDNQQARQHYLKAVKHIDEHSRAYSMASFALAGNYHLAGEKEKYMEYVIKAALGDLKNCTMENLALQDLAVCLFDESEEQITRAELYINTSMEDAKFYNNRLRILEISRTLPQIMNTYQATIVAGRTQKLRYSVVFISLLVLGALCSRPITSISRTVSWRREGKNWPTATNNCRTEQAVGRQLPATGRTQPAIEGTQPATHPHQQTS